MVVQPPKTSQLHPALLAVGLSAIHEQARSAGRQMALSTGCQNWLSGSNEVELTGHSSTFVFLPELCDLHYFLRHFTRCLVNCFGFKKVAYDLCFGARHCLVSL